jgi:hypothetical protein
MTASSLCYLAPGRPGPPSPQPSRCPDLRSARPLPARAARPPLTTQPPVLRPADSLVPLTHRRPDCRCPSSTYSADRRCPSSIAASPQLHSAAASSSLGHLVRLLHQAAAASSTSLCRSVPLCRRHHLPSWPHLRPSHRQHLLGLQLAAASLLHRRPLCSGGLNKKWQHCLGLIVVCTKPENVNSEIILPIS